MQDLHCVDLLKPKGVAFQSTPLAFGMSKLRG